MPRRLAQQRMTLSDLEWPFHDSSVLSVWERNIIRIARYLSTVAELLVKLVDVRYICDYFFLSVPHQLDLLVNTDIQNINQHCSMCYVTAHFFATTVL